MWIKTNWIFIEKIFTKKNRTLIKISTLIKTDWIRDAKLKTQLKTKLTWKIQNYFHLGSNPKR